jgi:hypothetical protein
MAYGTLLAAFGYLSCEVFASSSLLRNESVKKLMERIIKVGHGLAPYKSLTSVVKGTVDGSSQQAWINVAECELRILHTLNRGSIGELLNAFVDEILSMDGLDMFPIRHARFLIEKARHLRVESKETLNEVDSLCTHAIELLKADVRYSLIHKI